MRLRPLISLADENEWERLRIENGIPRWGRELTPDIIPPEANLAERAIDYEKGCYIGQEVISRMKMSGQLRQRLCGLISEKRLFLRPRIAGGRKSGWSCYERCFFLANGFEHWLGDDQAPLQRYWDILARVDRKGANECSHCRAARERWIGCRGRRG